MKTGLLWYDDNPKRSLAQKVARAAARYRQKYGLVPDVCFVHPTALQGADQTSVGSVSVTKKPSVLPHHFWIGVQDAQPNQATH